MKVKEESKKVGLKLNIQKTKIIWSHHFMGNRWETVETVSDLILGGSKITADGDCSHSDWCEMVPHSGFDLHFSDD